MKIVASKLEENPLFRHLFEQSQMGICIVTLDGRIVKLNPSALSFLGYTMDELVNVNVEGITHPEDLERSRTLFQQLVSGQSKSYEIEKRYIHKDGTTLWGQIKVAMTEIEGHPIVATQIKDITEEKMAKTKYKEAEAHYRVLVTHALDLITMISYDGVLLYCSPASASLLGYLPSEMTDQEARQFCHPDDWEKLKAFFDNTMQVIGKGTLTHRVIHKEGRVVWFESTFIKVSNKDGVDTLYVWSRDVTQKKVEQKLLKESEERYKSLYKYHPDMVFSMDLEGHFTSINLSCETITGYSEEDLLYSDLNYIKIVQPEDHDYVNKRFQEAIGGHVQCYECRVRIKNGQMLLISVTNIPILVDGEVVGVFGVGRNIQKRRYAELALKTMNDQLEAFINNHLDPILIFNSNDQLVKVNQTFDRVYGWDGQALIGKNVRELEAIPREELPNLLNRLEILRKGEAVGHVETVRLKKDGTQVPTIVTSFPILNEKGEADGWASAFRDISEQKKAEQLMINSEKLSVAGQLAAGIAHEIRNPLTAVKGFIQLLQRSKGQGKSQHYFEIVTSEIERIESIVSELLILAKPQKVVFQRVNLASLIEDVVQLLFSQAILNNVQLNVQRPEKECTIYCEVNQIKQVFINFIKNGIEAMPSGGTMTIGFFDEDDMYCRIFFQDEGVGIPKEWISKLGQPFYTTKEKGTGLGFMVSKKIIEDHRGCLHVTSEPNKGTLIEVKLPIKKMDPHSPFDLNRMESSDPKNPAKETF